MLCSTLQGLPKQEPIALDQDVKLLQQKHGWVKNFLFRVQCSGLRDHHPDRLGTTCYNRQRDQHGLQVNMQCLSFEEKARTHTHTHRIQLIIFHFCGRVSAVEELPNHGHNLAVHLQHDLERLHLPCPTTSARQVEHNSHCAGLTLSEFSSNKNNGIAVIVMTMHIFMIRMMRSSLV